MIALQWVRYQGQGKIRYFLALHLGTQQGKHLVLECQLIPDGEVMILRELRQRLHHLSLEKRLELLRHACPTAMHRAYRTIAQTHYEVLQEYNN